MVPMLLLVFAAVAAPSVSNCSSGQAPASYTSASCAGVCWEVATMGSLYSIYCDIDASSRTVDAEIHFVHDYPEYAYINFSAWGTTADGTDFCCFIDDTGNQVFETILEGSPRADTMSYQGDGESMEDPTTGGFAAHIYGYNGDDVLTGSTETEALFKDYLHGGLGADTCFGDQGGDRLEGEGGDDELNGMGCDDIIRAGTGSDTLSGASGNNTLCGGGNGSVTGDSFAALLGTNVFWAPFALFTAAPTGSVTGSSTTCGSTTWGSSWVSGTCSYTLTSEPAGCSGWW